MCVTLNIGQTVGDFRVEEFVKTSADGSVESYFVSDKDGRKALLKLHTVPDGRIPVEYEAVEVFASHPSFASDLGSIYIHGTQDKIAELFEEAAKKAPAVLCFDELDGMVPDRATVHNEGAAGEVNEFLSQLNNCSERGIFVIGTSNRPEKSALRFCVRGVWTRWFIFSCPIRQRAGNCSGCSSTAAIATGASISMN